MAEPSKPLPGVIQYQVIDYLPFHNQYAFLWLNDDQIPDQFPDIKTIAHPIIKQRYVCMVQAGSPHGLQRDRIDCTTVKAAKYFVKHWYACKLKRSNWWVPHSNPILTYFSTVVVLSSFPKAIAYKLLITSINEKDYERLDLLVAADVISTLEEREIVEVKGLMQTLKLNPRLSLCRQLSASK
jgi:hypothetical protein